MRAPLVLYLAIAAQGVPLVTAAAVRRPTRGARAWVLAWCALLLVVDGLGTWLAQHETHNLWLTYLVTPAGGALVLWALSLWQRGEVPRLTMRLAIVAFLLVWAMLTLAFEDTSTFSRAAKPMASLVGLGAAAFTLLSRGHSAGGELLRYDWFWVSAGIALYYGSASTIGPLATLLIGDAPPLVARAYEVKAALDIGAFLAIARGMTCPAAT